jgi:hypothetical protein
MTTPYQLSASAYSIYLYLHSICGYVILPLQPEDASYRGDRGVSIGSNRRKEGAIFTVSDSSVGIALGYGLDYWGSRVRFPAGAGKFSPPHRVQNGSGAHPDSYPMGTKVSFPGIKEAGA